MEQLRGEGGPVSTFGGPPSLPARGVPRCDGQRPSWFFTRLHLGIYATAPPLQESCYHQLREQESQKPVLF